MSGDSVALDTSVAIAVLAGQAGTLLSQSPEEFLLPVPVIGELRYGALNSRRSAENLAEVERLVARCRVLDITAATLQCTRGFDLASKRRASRFPRTTCGSRRFAWCMKSHSQRSMGTSMRSKDWSGARSSIKSFRDLHRVGAV